MKAYKHLVFDIDGTLIDTVNIHMVSLERILKNFGERMQGFRILGFPLEFRGRLLWRL